MGDSSCLVEFRDLAGVYIEAWGFLYAKRPGEEGGYIVAVGEDEG